MTLDKILKACNEFAGETGLIIDINIAGVEKEDDFETHFYINSDGEPRKTITKKIGDFPVTCTLFAKEK